MTRFIGGAHGVGPADGARHIEGQIVRNPVGLPEHAAGTAAQVGDRRPPECDFSDGPGKFSGRFIQQGTMRGHGDREPVGFGRAFLPGLCHDLFHGFTGPGDDELVGCVEIGEKDGIVR